MQSQDLYKNYQLRLDKSLYEKFFRAFPGIGERKLLLERFIELAVELKGQRDCFILGVLEEARNRYSDYEEGGE